MLIKIHDLKNNYCIDFTNILHIGAHDCEELSDYTQLGAKNIHWVEAMKDKIKDIVFSEKFYLQLLNLSWHGNQSTLDLLKLRPHSKSDKQTHP